MSSIGAFFGAMCELFQLKLAPTMLPGTGRGFLTHEVVENVALRTVGVLDPHRISRAGSAELADIEVAAVGVDLDTHILGVLEGNDIARLQPADRVEGRGSAA